MGINIPFDALFLPTLVIAIATFMITLGTTRSLSFSCFLVLAKAGLFFVYFNYFFDGSFTLSDDWGYIRESLQVLSEGYTTLDLVQIPLFKLLHVFANKHYIYHMLNIISYSFFGIFYSSPVALNIILTMVTASLWYSALRVVGFSDSFSKWFFVFFCLHWELLTWTQLLNLKESLALLLISLIVSGIIKSEHKKAGILDYILIILPIYILLYTRFYIPALLISAYFLYRSFIIFRRLALFSKVSFLTLMMPLSAAFLSLVITFYSEYVPRFLIGFSNPILGSINYLLTPIPFNMSPEYSFLYFSSILHWLSFPFLLFGAWTLFREKPRLFYLLISILAVFLVFYGSFSILRGPRHRIQILFIFTLFQYCGFVGFIKTYFINLSAKTKNHEEA